MEAPLGFRRALDQQSLGKLRIRWSRQFNEWQIEEKVSNPITPSFRVDEFDDRAIRYRDGYALLMKVRNGDRMPCPDCRATVKIAVGEMWETKCKVCGKGILAVYFPLSEMLLEHLRRIDPQRGAYQRLAAELAYADGKESRDMKRLSDEAQLGAREEFRQFFGVPMVGYTGGS